MRLKLFFILLTFISFSFAKKGISENPIKTVITGQIVNFDKLPDYNSIELSIPDVLSESLKTKKTISKNGQFKFEVYISNSSNAWLRYKSNFPIFISPGDSIHLTFDNGFINSEPEKYEDLYSYLKVTGTSEKINKNVSEFLAFFEDSIYHPMALNDSLKEYEAMPAREFLNRELERYNIELEKFNIQNNTTEHFREWANNHLKFRIGSKLFQYPAFHAFLNRIKKPANGYYSLVPVEYFSFLNSFENIRNDELFETKIMLTFYKVMLDI